MDGDTARAAWISAPPARENRPKSGDPAGDDAENPQCLHEPHRAGARAARLCRWQPRPTPDFPTDRDPMIHDFGAPA
ncbi:hypothetical protein P279_28195 [Rhodobacteraceae bacterium PD-2]|nr:hypothetical protein P279_28195 [Rhodobacteraceae bacterium PD-2]